MKYLMMMLLGSCSQVALANTVCLTDSDSDGDGWGWENGKSCVIANNAECVDSDGDGWGWDGEKSCKMIPLTIEYPEPGGTRCEDSAPIGDTWGWDGMRSCRIAPVLTGGDTSAISGVWDKSQPELDLIVYLHIAENGSFTQYTLDAGMNADCFIANENISASEGRVLSPLGGNLYQTDAYHFESSYTDPLNGATYYDNLVLSSYVSTYYIDDFSGALIIEQIDRDDEDQDGNTDEAITISLPSASQVNPEFLSVCAVL